MAADLVEGEAPVAVVAREQVTAAVEALAMAPELEAAEAPGEAGAGRLPGRKRLRSSETAWRFHSVVKIDRRCEI